MRLKVNTKETLRNSLLIGHFVFSPQKKKIDAPSCSPNQPRIYGVAKQEQAQIRCSVDANPPDVEFKWTFNNSAESIDVASNHVTRSGKIHTTHIVILFVFAFINLLIVSVARSVVLIFCLVFFFLRVHMCTQTANGLGGGG